LSAVEHGHGIVFLHAVDEGPASQSYGLQVAQLAGVPPAVIRAARKHLAHLEQQSVTRATPQLDLFAAPAYAEDAPDDFSDTRTDSGALVEHPALERLKGIDPNELRAREALDLIYELHELATAANARGVGEIER
jgi:DNA mismatch repair protein MutS